MNFLKKNQIEKKLGPWVMAFWMPKQRAKELPPKELETRTAIEMRIAPGMGWAGHERPSPHRRSRHRHVFQGHVSSTRAAEQRRMGWTEDGVRTMSVFSLHLYIRHGILVFSPWPMWNFHGRSKRKLGQCQIGNKR